MEVYINKNRVQYVYNLLPLTFIALSPYALYSPTPHSLLPPHLVCERFLTGSIDSLRGQRNAVQKDVATKKKAKEPCDEMVAQIKTIGKGVWCV